MTKTGLFFLMASVFFMFAAYKYAPDIIGEHGALANVMEKFTPTLNQNVLRLYYTK